MKKSQSIIWTQHAMRNTPTLAPETEYCLPDSRFALMMRLARMGASDRLIRKKVPGIDTYTIRVLRKIADGTISGGRGRKAEYGEEAGELAG